VSQNYSATLETTSKFSGIGFAGILRDTDEPLELLLSYSQKGHLYSQLAITDETIIYVCDCLY
jgi:hypothetical protein